MALRLPSSMAKTNKDTRPTKKRDAATRKKRIQGHHRPTETHTQREQESHPCTGVVLFANVSEWERMGGYFCRYNTQHPETVFSDQAIF